MDSNSDGASLSMAAMTVATVVSGNDFPLVCYRRFGFEYRSASISAEVRRDPFSVRVSANGCARWG
jgi:hypothetical protein